MRLRSNGRLSALQLVTVGEPSSHVAVKADACKPYYWQDET